MINPLLNEDALEIVNKISAEDARRLRGARILISGAAGFLGSSLLAGLMSIENTLRLGINVVALTREKSRAVEIIKRYKGTKYAFVSDWTKIGTANNQEQFDFIFHTAATTSPGEFAGPRSGFMEGDITRSAALFRAVRPGGVFVLLSSVEIYGQSASGKGTLAKEHELNGIDPSLKRSSYPLGKLAVEGLGKAFGEDYGFQFSSVRLDHVLGPSLRLGDGRVLGDFFSDAMSRDEIAIRSDGSHLLLLTYISDAIPGLIRVALSGTSRAYNLCASNPALSLLELAEILTSVDESVAKRVIVLGQSIDPVKYLSFQTPSLDSSELRKLGWNPEVSNEDAVRRVVRALHQQGILRS